MTAAIPGLDPAPTKHAKLIAWVREIAELTQPDRVHWCDGSDAEWDAPDRTSWSRPARCKRLNPDKRPNSFYAASDPRDVARVESRTFICSENEDDAGPTNNWMRPGRDARHPERPVQGRHARPHHVRRALLHGPARLEDLRPRRRDHRQRLCRHLDAGDDPHGQGARWTRIGEDGFFVPGRAHPGRAAGSRARRTCPGPATTTKYIVHFPESREIWSYGSGYGGNALLGKKCYALRIASVMARDEGWLAEHMLILKLTSPEGAVALHRRRLPRRPAARPTWPCCSRPSRAGRPRPSATTSAGCASARTAGSTPSTRRPASSAWRRAPARPPTRTPSTPCYANCVFTNVALTDDGDVWWEGLTDTPPAHLTDWKGRAWTPDIARARRPPQRPLHRAGRPVPDHRAGVGGPRRACRSRPSCSAAAAPPRCRW